MLLTKLFPYSSSCKSCLLPPWQGSRGEMLPVVALDSRRLALLGSAWDEEDGAFLLQPCQTTSAAAAERGLHFLCNLLQYFRCCHCMASWSLPPAGSMCPPQSWPITTCAQLRHWPVARSRGAKAIILVWRILTQTAREKQIGREMNKLYQ